MYSDVQMFVKFIYLYFRFFTSITIFSDSAQDICWRESLVVLIRCGKFSRKLFWDHAGVSGDTRRDGFPLADNGSVWLCKKQVREVVFMCWKHWGPSQVWSCFSRSGLEKRCESSSCRIWILEWSVITPGGEQEVEQKILTDQTPWQTAQLKQMSVK